MSPGVAVYEFEQPILSAFEYSPLVFHTMQVSLRKKNYHLGKVTCQNKMRRTYCIVQLRTKIPVS